MESENRVNFAERNFYLVLSYFLLVPATVLKVFMVSMHKSEFCCFLSKRCSKDCVLRHGDLEVGLTFFST